MNLRCFYCQTPFTLGRPEMLAALQRMEAENLNHYDAHCPRCRRANSISRERIEMFFPNWRQVAAEEQAGNPSVPSPTSPEAPASQPADEQPMPLAPPTAPAPLMRQPAMEAVPEGMKSAARKPARKRSRPSKKAKPVAAKKTAAKAAKKAKAKTTSKAASKSKAKPAAKKKTAAKKKKK